MDEIEKRARRIYADQFPGDCGYETREWIMEGKHGDAETIEAIIAALSHVPSDVGIPTSVPEGFVMVSLEQKKNAERYEWLRDNQSCSISIQHNDHHLSYDKAEDVLDDPQGYYDNCSEEDRQRMEDLDSIWTIHEYPNTPVGFNVWHASSLDAAVDAAMASDHPEVPND